MLTTSLQALQSALWRMPSPFLIFLEHVFHTFCTSRGVQSWRSSTWTAHPQQWEISIAPFLSHLARDKKYKKAPWYHLWWLTLVELLSIAVIRGWKSPPTFCEINLINLINPLGENIRCSLHSASFRRFDPRYPRLLEALAYNTSLTFLSIAANRRLGQVGQVGRVSGSQSWIPIYPQRPNPPLEVWHGRTWIEFWEMMGDDGRCKGCKDVKVCLQFVHHVLPISSLNYLNWTEHDRTGAFPEFYYVLPTRSKQFCMLLRDTVCRFQHSNLVSSRRICIHYLARFWDSLRNWLQASLGFGRCSGESFVHAEYQHLTDTWAYNSVLTAWLDQCTSQFSRREWSQGGNVWQSWSQLENMANISIIPTPWNISNSVDIRLTAGGFQDIPTFTESYRVPTECPGILWAFWVFVASCASWHGRTTTSGHGDGAETHVLRSIYCIYSIYKYRILLIYCIPYVFAKICKTNIWDHLRLPWQRESLFQTIWIGSLFRFVSFCFYFW